MIISNYLRFFVLFSFYCIYYFFKNICLLLIPQFSDAFTLLLRNNVDIIQPENKLTIEDFISVPFDAKLRVQNHNANH